MSVSLRRFLVAGAFAALTVAPAALHAQASTAAADSLAFPRKFVNWVFAANGDSAWAHAGPQLREGMKSSAGVAEMAVRIAGRFGEKTATTAEVQFDEGPLKVYIAAMTFAQAPAPAAWVVAYNPATGIAERASFGALENIKNKYPQAKLP